MLRMPVVAIAVAWAGDDGGRGLREAEKLGRSGTSESAVCSLRFSDCVPSSPGVRQVWSPSPALESRWH